MVFKCRRILIFCFLLLPVSIYSMDTNMSVGNSKLRNEKNNSIGNEEKEFKIESLTLPLQIWQVDLPNKDIGSAQITISFFGTKFYQKDIDKKKYTQYEKIDSILTGFETISTIGNSKISPDCHFPEVNIIPLQGIKESNGTIRLFSYITTPIFSGSANFFQRAVTEEIYDIKGNEAQFITSEIRFDRHTKPFSGNRIGPLQIKRVQ